MNELKEKIINPTKMMEPFENIKVTDEQQSILEKAMELLKPFDKEETVNYMCFFRDKDGAEMGSEYDCCNDEKCIEKTKKEIRMSYGNRKVIEECVTDTSRDYEQFERCCQCGSYFNEYLTWIEMEFDHHEEHSTSLEEFERSQVAYELRGIYYSLYWNCDNQISEYDKHQYHLGNEKPLNNRLRNQRELIERVVKHAELVIKEFSINQ